MTESFSYEDTFRTGFLLGEKAGPGDVYCLCGDLGVGKTVFTQGFAKCLPHWGCGGDGRNWI